MKKYLAVISDIEHRIAEGDYRQGGKLPSVRSAAERYGCSVSTVIRAYAELEKRHAIYTVPQSGYYVVDKKGDSSGGGETDRIDFASAMPDEKVFPYLDFQHCMNKAIDQYKHQLFAYGDSKGLDKLRTTLASHLAGDQVFTGADRIAVTSGVQQALEILARMPFPNGKSTILVEQPSYNLYLRFLEREGMPVSGIARTAKGIDLLELEERFKSGGIKFFYTMPRHHNPLGTSFSAEERKKIAAMAGKYDVYVVEDDYMADLDEERGFEPIFAYDRSSRVVYLKSFSKIIFPGLRLGIAVLPERLLEAFLSYRTYPDTSLLSQAALEVYIKNGMYERHKRKISGQYAARIRALSEAFGRYPDADRMEISNAGSGIYAQLKLPQTVNLDRLTRRLADRKVSVVSGRSSYLSGYLERDKFLRLSISRVRPEQIEEGVSVIVQEAALEIGGGRRNGIRKEWDGSL